jgi:glycine betaine/proline transport system substrate-binding protein
MRFNCIGRAFPAALFAAFFAVVTQAAGLPGKGVTVRPGQDNIDGENFQTIIVIKALQALGYDVQPVQFAKYPALHVAIANGDVDFMADHWDPLHQAFYDKAGGAASLTRVGDYIAGCAQGYLIDKATAEAHGIDNIGQLTDGKIAGLFDANGDGKADLAGCVPGWGCERVIEHQMDAFNLRGTVTHNQGEYSPIIADTIARYREGKPVLYYTWTPYWVSGVLVPGQDVTWLEVPMSAHPNGVDTSLPNGRNYGFLVNTQKILANKRFLADNPAARRLFEVMQLPVNAVSAQNLVMQKEGENTWNDAARHADAWIKANRKTFDSWLHEAKRVSP